MVHTFELSRIISKEMFDTLLKVVKGCKYNKVAWFSKEYADDGIQMICLRKFKPRKKNKDGDWIVLEDAPFYYMIILCINTGVMFGGDGYLSNNTLNFTPSFAKAIYSKIFELIPELEIKPELLVTGNTLWEEGNIGNSFLQEYYQLNGFKLRRIDFAFDIAVAPQYYIQLLEWGKGVQRKAYERKYFDEKESSNVDEIEFIEDDEPDFDDMDDLMYEYEAENEYIYYVSKSSRINIYLKGEQLKRAGLINNDDDSYNFLRIEFQIKKNNINARNRNLKRVDKRTGKAISGRDFHNMAIPELETGVLKYYIGLLSYCGIHMTCAKAKKVIESHGYTKLKEQRLIKLLDLIAINHGAKAVIEKAEKKELPDFPNVRTLKGYLNEISKLGINPVTISKETAKGMKPQIFKNVSNGQELPIKALISLADAITAYNEQIKYEQQHDRIYTAEDFEKIDKLH